MHRNMQATSIMPFSRERGTATCLLPWPGVISIIFIRYVFLRFWPIAIKNSIPSVLKTMFRIFLNLDVSKIFFVKWREYYFMYVSYTSAFLQERTFSFNTLCRQVKLVWQNFLRTIRRWTITWKRWIRTDGVIIGNNKKWFIIPYLVWG
jgi:hypothetical protein